MSTPTAPDTAAFCNTLIEGFKRVFIAQLRAGVDVCDILTGIRDALVTHFGADPVHAMNVARGISISLADADSVSDAYRAGVRAALLRASAIGEQVV